jgi:hypothetical protein
MLAPWQDISLMYCVELIRVTSFTVPVDTDAPGANKTNAQIGIYTKSEMFRYGNHISEYSFWNSDNKLP